MANIEDLIKLENKFPIEDLFYPSEIYSCKYGFGNHSTNVTENGLFNKITANEWNTKNIAYLENPDHHIDMLIDENCDIYRSGTTSWMHAHNSKMEILEYIDGEFTNVTSQYTQDLTPTNENTINKWISNIGPGRFKFYTNTSRIDSEWYLVLTQEEGFPQAASPKDGDFRVSSNDNVFLKTGLWENVQDDNYSGGVKRYSSKIGSNVSFRFLGTSFSILSEGHRKGCQIEVSLDGGNTIVDTFKRNSANKQAVIYTSDNLENKIHTVSITNISEGEFVFEAIDLPVGSIILPEISRDYEFPIGVIEKEDIAEFASELINGEEQLLISRGGEMYLTDGLGNYKIISEYINKSDYYNKQEVDTIISTIEPPVGATHTHDNANTLSDIADSAGMLTYKGKVVVNSNEYSFRTLPRATIRENYSVEKGGRLPWLI